MKDIFDDLGATDLGERKSIGLPVRRRPRLNNCCQSSSEHGCLESVVAQDGVRGSGVDYVGP